MGDGAIAAGRSEDLFGREPTNRRQKTGEGTAYPLRDGRDGVGALVIFGPNEDLDPGVRERVMWLAVDTGPRFAAAAAVRAAEERANTDNLTGLPNRAGLERAMEYAPHGPCAVLCVDLDDFKKIDEELGHAAGDAVLKHAARVFRGAIRDIDVAARVGGEEFVVWLPETDQKAAREVAERIRRTVADLDWEWAGAGVTLTCSIGVSARPETTSDIPNLIPAADAALDRAKRAGRNRVEVATAEVKQSG
jgi:diguanylate cyclase (GGDEF)-like protein